jgi:phosphate transport system protein
MKAEHTDKKYQAGLQDLRQRLLRMAGMVEQMISDSVKALTNRDLDLARRTIEADNKVNRFEIEADELCLVILAKWQPMATDLRFVTLALKMVTDLERIGDLAVNVCERVIELGDSKPLKPYEDIPRMAEIVQQMIHDAVDAFVVGDTDKAQQVIDRDDEVDRLYWMVFKELLDLMRANEANVEKGMRVQSVAKVLERMADHTTNLAEQVIFLIDGEDVRHRGKLGKQ